MRSAKLILNKVKWLWLLLLVLSFQSHAEQKKTLGNWDVHYIAFNTTFLTPEIARANNIQRSSNNTLVNISVLDRTSKQAQEVVITGTARNLLGNTIELDFKQVNEGDAIYYLAVMPFDDEEHYRFKIDLSQQQISQTLTFEQKLYKEQ
ncbi:DUF4426 domain-containing protein [Aliiglaciecola litoralis]|uniref:DUF4426 domain-containing protein n=1 Tax=Aliiglaciecola litoralis TaxID=582857 RepID=A0ABP3WRC5_9ALTE